MSTPAISWAIVVPVKRLADAKTRIDTAPATRERLALAMALDTVGAALACASVRIVVAVTDDSRAAAALRKSGADVVADEPGAGLNPALSHGVLAAAARVDGVAVAALSSDLPALRPHELAGVLESASRHAAAVVADAAGLGTTMLTARSAHEFRPAFGEGSRSAHVGLGAVDLTASAGESVRRDVDTIADLLSAAELGCGPATSALLAEIGDLLP